MHLVFSLHEVVCVLNARTNKKSVFTAQTGEKFPTQFVRRILLNCGKNKKDVFLLHKLKKIKMVFLMHELVMCRSAMPLYGLQQFEDRSIRRKILNFAKKKICLNKCIYCTNWAKKNVSE